jgi:hypothetical protein
MGVACPTGAKTAVQVQGAGYDPEQMYMWAFSCRHTGSGTGRMFGIPQKRVRPDAASRERPTSLAFGLISIIRFKRAFLLLHLACMAEVAQSLGPWNRDELGIKMQREKVSAL